MASFNGVDLGFIFEMNTSADEPELLIRTYPGANGLQILEMGRRGLQTSVEGAVIAPSVPALASALGSIRSLQLVAGTYTLIDNDGTSWLGVRMRSFDPYGPRCYIVGTPVGFVGKRFRAQFLHNS